jgi:predicted O-linked N-acetylglucosamine transferase (SPINDLY family)
MELIEQSKEDRQTIPIEVAIQHALRLHHQGRLEDALAIYQAILQAVPQHADAMHLLAATFLQQGQAKVALDYVDGAMQINPGQSFYHNTKAQALRALSRHDESLAELQTALELMPQNAEAHYNLGEALLQYGQPANAEAEMRRALTIRPVFAQAAAGLSQALRAQGDQGGALPYAQLAQSLESQRMDFALNLAILFLELGHFNLAEQRFKGITERDGQQVVAWTNLAVCQTLTNRRTDAITSYRKAWQLAPQSVGILDGLYEAMRQACDWQGLQEVEDAYVQQVRAHLSAGVPSPARGFTVLYAPLTAQEQLQVCKGVTRPFQLQFPQHLWQQGRLAWPQEGRRLRVGYISADIKEHPMAHLIQDLFAGHDRERLEIFLYSMAMEDYSAFRQHIRGTVEHFVECFRLPDKDIAEHIAADGVDVLIDLMGHTRDNRLGVLARKPAPIQMSYVGYPGSTGAQFVDYYIGDAVTIPEGVESEEFSEKIVRLPYFYMVNSHSRIPLGETPARRTLELPEEGVVFCSMNNSYKIDPFIFDIWCRVLRETPDSVLWLLQMAPEMQDHLRREAKACGVDGQRLVFAARVPRDAHLTRMQTADLFLDTRFYNAHTTALDALAAGVPVLTARGDRFAGRVAESALRNLGFTESIAPDWEAYTDMALEVGRNAALRQHWKQQVRALKVNAPLFDTSTTVRALETAYLEAARRWREGLGPAAMRILPDTQVELQG